MIKKIIVAILLLVCNTISAFAFDKWDYLNDVKAASWNPLSAYNSIYLGASYQNIVKAFPSSQWIVQSLYQHEDGTFGMCYKRQYDITLPDGKRTPAKQYINIYGDAKGVCSFTIDFNINIYENITEDTYRSFLTPTEHYFGQGQEKYSENREEETWIRPNNNFISVFKTKTKYVPYYMYTSGKHVRKNY